MRVYKPTYKKNGEIRRYQNWYLEMRDHNGIVRRFPGFADKKQTRILGENIEKLIICRMNNEPPSRQLSKWIERIPAKLRSKLARTGILDNQRAAAGKKLTEHITDFESHLSAKNNTDKYIGMLISRLNKIIEACKFVYWTDISANKVESYLADERAKDLSVQTSNFYLQAVKEFCTFMVRNGRASESPIRHLQGLNARTDRRHDRRPLEIDEARRLIETVQSSTELCYGMVGRERSLLYRVAIETGLRRDELRRLTVSAFDFDNCVLTFVSSRKNKSRTDSVPLRPQTAQMLKEFFAGKLPMVKAFGGTYKQLTDKTAKMLRQDLESANIQYVRDGRYLDFHSLRHTTGTWLAAHGVEPKTAQEILRHSDINLTMNYYTHTLTGQKAQAINKLPDINAPAKVRTGTDDASGR